MCKFLIGNIYHATIKLSKDYKILKVSIPYR